MSIVDASNKKNIKWVSDLIGQDYVNWNNKVILLQCGMGKGKTTFSLGVYCKYLFEQGKKVIYLCNRKALEEQINSYLSVYGLSDLSVITYQKLNEMILSNVAPKADVFICDEAHFFLSDAVYNLYTDVAYEYLLNQEDKIVLFMTATGQKVFSMIEHDCQVKRQITPIRYELDSDYGYVNNVYWYKKSDLYKIIDDILENTTDKIIYFCNNIGKMEELYDYYKKQRDESGKRYLDSMIFKCSEYSQAKFAKKSCTKEKLKNNQASCGFGFEERMLITTKCLDNGLDFKDEKINHIILHVFNDDLYYWSEEEAKSYSLTSFEIKKSNKVIGKCDEIFMFKDVVTEIEIPIKTDVPLISLGEVRLKCDFYTNWDTPWSTTEEVFVILAPATEETIAKTRQQLEKYR